MSAERSQPGRPVETQAMHVAAAQAAAAKAAAAACSSPAPTVEPPLLAKGVAADPGGADATGIFTADPVAPAGDSEVGTIASEVAGTHPPQPPDATGMFLPEATPPAPAPAPAASQSNGAAPPPVAATHPPNPPSPDATLDIAPGSAQGGATGVYVPEPTQAFESLPGSPLHPTEAGATGVYVPGQTGAADGRPADGPVDPNATVAVAAVGGYDRTVAATCDGDAARPAANRTDPNAPRCGRYVLKKFHARGGMGEIWMAEDPTIGRQVALKRMLGQRPDQIHRFLVEAQVTGQLEHPGIVPVHELGTNEKGEPFYVMKFVQGRTLQKIIEDYHARPGGGGRDVEQFRLLQIFQSLCQTVAYAHSHGVLHRDLKPENVMLGPYGETILLDWGIAKVMGQPDRAAGGESGFVHLTDGEDDEETQTRAGAIMGTPSYMAPEVAAGLNSEVDHRSDIYLLGATLYEILTGRQPRKAKTALEMIKQAQKEPPVPSTKINPRVPRPLDAICRKAMAQRKEERYQSAMDLADDVQRFIAGEPVSAYPEGPLRRAWRWAKRHRKALGRAAAAVLVTGLLALSYAEIRKSETKRLELARETQRLKGLEQARLEVKEFRRLADEARFFAATTDPVSEHSAYFDPSRGEALAASAFALAVKWGPSVERLPLAEEREPLQADLYDLRLLAAQLKVQPGSDAGSTREALALLEGASKLRAPTRGLERVRARALKKLGDAPRAAEVERRAEDPRVPVTATDLFLQGEEFRKEAVTGAEGPSERKIWELDPRRVEKAIASYREALAIAPDHYWSRFQLGRCYMNLRRSSEAVEALGSCVALRPDAYFAYTARAIAYQMQDRHQDAERDLDVAIRLSPDARASRLNRAVVYFLRKKYDEALADFDAVLQPPKDKQLIEACYYRGQLHAQLGDDKKALEDYDRVVAEYPGFRRVYYDRIPLRIKRGDGVGALADVDAFLAEGKEPGRPEWILHGLRGHFLRLLHAELPQDKRAMPVKAALAALALQELNTAVKQGGNAADLFDDAGAMLEHIGDVRDAITAYTVGLKLEPRNVKLLNKRGWAYLAINRPADARADFEAAARSEPENAEAHAGSGYLRALGKLHPEAQREAELALLHGVDDYLVVHNVACIYAALSQSSGRDATADQAVAIALLRRAVSLWKKSQKTPSEIDLMKSEPAFEPLRNLADFQQLIRESS